MSRCTAHLPAAIDRYKKAANFRAQSKDEGAAYNNLGYAYKDIGDFIDARESLQKAVEADPEFAGAWISLGLMAQKTGDLHWRSVPTRAHAAPSLRFGYLLLAGALDQSGESSGRMPRGSKQNCCRGIWGRRNATRTTALALGQFLSWASRTNQSQPVKHITGFQPAFAYNPAEMGDR